MNSLVHSNLRSLWFFHIFPCLLHHAFPIALRSPVRFIRPSLFSLCLAIEIRCVVVRPPCVPPRAPSCVARARLVGSLLRSLVRNNVYFLCVPACISSCVLLCIPGCDPRAFPHTFPLCSSYFERGLPVGSPHSFPTVLHREFLSDLTSVPPHVRVLFSFTLRVRFLRVQPTRFLTALHRKFPLQSPSVSPCVPVAFPPTSRMRCLCVPPLVTYCVTP